VLCVPRSSSEVHPDAHMSDGSWVMTFCDRVCDCLMMMMMLLLLMMMMMMMMMLLMMMMMMMLFWVFVFFDFIV